MTTYTLWTDPGHGWLSVPVRKLLELGISQDITLYSYQRGEQVFLEEDCDLSTFARALEKNGEQLKYVVKNTNRQSKIRSYANFEASAYKEISHA